MEAKEVIQRLCKLQSEVYEHIGQSDAADCFCGEGGFWQTGEYDGTHEHGYRNDGKALEFIERAVRAALPAQAQPVAQDIVAGCMVRFKPEELEDRRRHRFTTDHPELLALMRGEAVRVNHVIRPSAYVGEQGRFLALHLDWLERATPVHAQAQGEAVAVPEGFRLVPTPEKLRELLVVGARIRIGEQYAKENGWKAGEILTLVEGEFDSENGLFCDTEYAPAVWNEEVGEFDSIYHLFENDLSEFRDCEVLGIAPPSPAKGGDTTGADIDIDVLTRAVDCPVCIAKAGEKCWGDGGLGRGAYRMERVHLGRTIRTALADRDARLSALSAEVEAKWIPVSERLPVQCEEPYQIAVLCVKRHEKGNYAGQQIKSVVQDWVVRRWPERFTHWTAFPAAPSRKEDGQ